MTTLSLVADVQSLSIEKIRCSCQILFFYLGEGICGGLFGYFLFGVFWEGAVLRGRHKGFFGEVGGGGNNVVCLI